MEEEAGQVLSVGEATPAAGFRLEHVLCAEQAVDDADWSPPTESTWPAGLTTR